ncbi:Hsp70 family protein [Rhodococcus sp. BP-349]|uniref:Hsp70 family protein n=1 Tax=unclassified Rhodococcus (in: high G+C Gram-positive bacteria) TaxID=192944 RepID=UPI001C9AA5A9|nr:MULTISPECIES: Hsp70 family protein [unclassified Rhodococcus (in: high G+C Gram-positive bacteria)]MBY6537518.1 Hsp70 family protein [Rhodococcus sp. BP-363]MBY6541855.1 Hsp70 family protein [Rhodococcus sp. BP-369]MBY6561085.1 Hsp70 family protein [Rhodococcus sp. BP-370]MBY6575377.1 Hsp70 family protein [Rhodococcus sp. BP-364]MBY6584678.1 Hsp70 family protein [Rhodococcus sp. BP-358]
MTVLGVSVGTSAVRLARPVQGLRAGVEAAFRHRAIDTTFDQAEQLAAESIGVILADPADPESISATGVAYRDDAQAGAVARAMARQHIVNYRLVPEVHAAVRFLRSTGDLDGLHVVGLYDLGSSGLSITVVDLDNGEVLASERSFAVSGNMFDATIRDNQIGRQQSGLDDVDGREFELRCRVAKEQLSSSGAVCLPGIGGLILLSREAFESMVAVPIEQSARLTRDVIARAGRPVEALVMIGGGSRIPLVRATLAGWVGLPTITPAEPELVAAKGAALSATPVDGQSHSGPVPMAAPRAAAPVVSAPTVAAPSVSAPVVAGPVEPRTQDAPAPEKALSAPSAETMAYSDVESREHSARDIDHSVRDSDLRPEVADPRAAETPSWLSGSGSAAPEQRSSRPRLPLIAAVGLAVMAAVGLALGYGATPSQSTADVPPADQAGTSSSDTPSTTTSTTTRTTTTTTPPPTTTTVPSVAPAPVEAPAPAAEDPYVAPAPAPPTIPGLPGVQLPPGIQIPPGLIPGF